MIIARRRSEDIEGIAVRGSAEFRARTREALMMLKPTAAFPLVRSHVGLIRQGKRSGMRAWERKPAFVAGEPTWRHSPTWYAGAIAHDAYHSKLYSDAKLSGGGAEPAPHAWTGLDAEKRCLAFQYTVLQSLGSDHGLLEYVARWAKNPTYAGAGGSATWVEYRRRWW
jgi:hypothetical protein